MLVTGHTGFKGSWLSFWLTQMGAQVSGIALAPDTTPSLFEQLKLAGRMKHQLLTIQDAQKLRARVIAAKPDIVFHLAAQALVLPSYEQPLETASTNIMGTVHLLEALRAVPPCRVAVMVTTDKVYRNDGLPRAFTEDDPLGGRDIYSASKAACDLMIAAYREVFLRAQGVCVITVRAGNVIGGGDWSAHRLIPDAVRAWIRDEVLPLRAPHATRPWQHVLEPLCAYLLLAEQGWHGEAVDEAWNIAPQAADIAPVSEVITLAREAFGRGEVAQDQADYPHEAKTLQLDNQKIRQRLGVAPHWSLKESVERTMRWYAKQQEGVAAEQLCLDDLRAYGAAL